MDWKAIEMPYPPLASLSLPANMQIVPNCATGVCVCADRLCPKWKWKRRAVPSGAEGKRQISQTERKRVRDGAAAARHRKPSRSRKRQTATTAKRLKATEVVDFQHLSALKSRASFATTTVDTELEKEREREQKRHAQ